MIGISLAADNQKPVVMPQPQVRDAIAVRVLLMVREQINKPTVIEKFMDRLRPFTHMPGSTNRPSLRRCVSPLDELSPTADRRQAACQKLPS
jgi:hypothetical protein